MGELYYQEGVAQRQNPKVTRPRAQEDACGKVNTPRGGPELESKGSSGYYQKGYLWRRGSYTQRGVPRARFRKRPGPESRGLPVVE